MEIPLSRYNLRSAKDETLQSYAAYVSKGHTVTRNTVTGRIRVVFNQDVLDREDEEMCQHGAEVVVDSDDDDDERSPAARSRSLSNTSSLTWPSDDEEKDEIEDADEGRAEGEPVDPRFVTPGLSTNVQPLVSHAPRKRTLAFDEHQRPSHEPTPTPTPMPPPAASSTDLAASLSSIEEDDIQIIDMDQDMDDLDGVYADDEASRGRSWTPDLILSAGTSSSNSIAGPSTPTSGRSLLFGNAARAADRRPTPSANSLVPRRAIKVEPDENREVTPFFDRNGNNVEQQVAANAFIVTALPCGPNGTQVLDCFGRQATVTEKRGRVDAEWYRYTPVTDGGFARVPSNWAPRWAHLYASSA